MGDEDPAAKATLDPVTWQPPDTGRKRIGRHRVNWLQETMQDL